MAHHFHAFKQWIRVYILTNTWHFPSFLILIDCCGLRFPNDQLNILSHIYCCGYLFYVKFPFEIFPPFIFLWGSLSLPLGLLCILYIPDTSVVGCLYFRVFVCFCVGSVCLLRCVGPWLWHTGSYRWAWASLPAVALRRQERTGSVVAACRLSCHVACGMLVQPGMNCPLQGGRFLTTGPPKEASLLDILIVNLSLHSV